MEGLAALPIGKGAGLRTGARRATARQQLERDRGERKDVGGRTPGTPFDSLGRRVRTPDRGADADLFKRLDDAEPGRARFVGRDKDVAWATLLADIYKGLLVETHS